MQYDFVLPEPEVVLRLRYKFHPHTKLFRNLQIRKWLREGKQLRWILEQVKPEGLTQDQSLYDIRDSKGYELIERDFRKELGIN